MLFSLVAGTILPPVQASPILPPSSVCTASLQQGGHSFDATASVGVSLTGLTVSGWGDTSMSASVGQNQLYPLPMLGTFCSGCGSCSTGLYCAPGAGHTKFQTKLEQVKLGLSVQVPPAAQTAQLEPSLPLFAL